MIEEEWITEEMVEVAARAFDHAKVHNVSSPSPLRASLRAVAPMIAARVGDLSKVLAYEAGVEAGASAERERAEAHTQHIRASAVRRADEHARAEERERCIKILSEALQKIGQNLNQ